MTFTMKHIQNAFDHLGRQRPARLNPSAKRDFSLREVVLFMAPKLMEMKELGFNTRELAAALAEKEIVIKAPTLNRYLSEYQARQEKAVIAGATATGPPVLKAGPPDENKTASAVLPGLSVSEPSDRAQASEAVSEGDERCSANAVQAKPYFRQERV